MVVKRALRLLLFVVLAAVGTLWWQQPAMIFYPSPGLVTTPVEAGLVYEEVKLTTADGVSLHGWYLPNPTSKKTLLFFHGNAGNISHRLDSLLIFHRLGLNVLIMDYRGYGRSEGNPGEDGLYRDADAAWQYLIEQRGNKAEDIVIMGRSLGGAVATWLAAKQKPVALIVESTFTSVREMARELFPLLSWLTPLRYRFDSASVMEDIRCPVLVVHSREDEIIPYTLGKKLYDTARQPKRFLEIRGGHNGGFLLSQPQYERGLRTFLREFVFQLVPNTSGYPKAYN